MMFELWPKPRFETFETRKTHRALLEENSSLAPVIDRYRCLR